MRQPVVVTFLSLSLATIGCGGSSTHKTPSDLGVGDMTVGDLAAAGDGGDGGAADACAANATAYCAIQARCNTTTLPTKYNNDCVARRTQSCLNGLNAPGTGATPASTAACAAAYATYDCADFSNGVPPTACLPQPGTGQLNAPCNYSSQCQSGFCAVAPNANCGTCQTATHPGDPCVDGACSAGLYCSHVTQVCKTHGAVGDACDNDDTCGYRLSCVGATNTTQGVCVQTVATAGLPCETKPSPTGSPAPSTANCDITLGLYCVGETASTKVCLPTTYAANTPAAPCGAMPSPTPTAYTLCVGGATCVYTDDKAQIGTCAAAAADGQACATATDPTTTTYAACLTPSKCVGSDIDGGINGGNGGGVVGVCDFPGMTYCQ